MTRLEGDELPAEYYVMSLIAKNSVNTAPIDTIQAYIDSFHSREARLPMPKAYLDEYFAEVAKCGIDMEVVYKTLMSDGLKQFEVAFGEILEICKQ